MAKIAAVKDKEDFTARIAAFGMRNYTRVPVLRTFENFICSIYFSDVKKGRGGLYEILMSLRFTSETNLSASRVGRGIRTPSQTCSVN
jgi:hypothetical protein